MREELKVRLYVTAVVLVMAMLYVGVVFSHAAISKSADATFASCLKGSTDSMMITKCERDHLAHDPQLGSLAVPYLPAALLFWVSWLFGLRYRLTQEHYPARTIAALRWVAYLAVAFSALVTFDIATSGNKPGNVLHVFGPTMLFAGWVIAPMLFQMLLAPKDLSSPPLALRIALGAMISMPFVGIIVFIIARYH